MEKGRQVVGVTERDDGGGLSLLRLILRALALYQQSRKESATAPRDLVVRVRAWLVVVGYSGAGRLRKLVCCNVQSLWATGER